MELEAEVVLEVVWEESLKITKTEEETVVKVGTNSDSLTTLMLVCALN